MSHIKKVLWKLLILITYNYEAFNLSSFNPHNVSYVGSGFNYSGHLLMRKLRLCVSLSLAQAHLIKKQHTRDRNQALLTPEHKLLITVWLVFLLFLSLHMKKSKCSFSQMHIEFWQSGRVLVHGNASIPFIQTASFSFCRAAG